MFIHIYIPVRLQWWKNLPELKRNTVDCSTPSGVYKRYLCIDMNNE